VRTNGSIMQKIELSIRLATQEYEYLKNAGFLALHQIDALFAANFSAKNGAVLKLSREEAEEFRASFTEQLARFGFDKNYDVTPEGRILESLIDRFFCK
jgi:hypothetical protein